MEKVTFAGNACTIEGNNPVIGDKAPKFELTGTDLNTITNSDFVGKNIVLNIFPSLDTPVCAASVRKFNAELSNMEDTVVLCVSMDLPFAAGRFCTLEGLSDVLPASAFRSDDFALNYGVKIADGPLAGLLARCVYIIDKEGNLVYRDMVSEITEEPDYKSAIETIKAL